MSIKCQKSAQVNQLGCLDKAEVLSRLNEGKLSNTLDDLAKKTGKEVRMVTIHRLDYGETTESFTNALFEKWFPTAETQANQILLVLDTVTNTTAIRTGESVKSVLADDIAKSVASETVTAPIRDGNKYNQAFSDASDRLVAVLSGNPDPGPPVVEETIQVASTFKKAEETDTQKFHSLGCCHLGYRHGSSNGYLLPLSRLLRLILNIILNVNKSKLSPNQLSSQISRVVKHCDWTGLSFLKNNNTKFLRSSTSK